MHILFSYFWPYQDQEVARKKLSSEVMQKRRISMLDNSSVNELIGDVSVHTKFSVDSADSSTKKIMEPLSSRIAGINAVINARQEVIQKNDFLCMTEKFIRDKNKLMREKKMKDKIAFISYQSNGALTNNKADDNSDDDTDDKANKIPNGFAISKGIKYALALSKSRPEDPLIMARALSKQHFEMLSALSTAPSLKSVKNTLKQRSAIQISTVSDSPKQPDSSLSKQPSTTSLSVRLDALEELLRPEFSRNKLAK